MSVGRGHYVVCRSLLRLRSRVFSLFQVRFAFWFFVWLVVIQIKMYTMTNVDYPIDRVYREVSNAGDSPIVIVGIVVRYYGFAPLVV